MQVIKKSYKTTEWKKIMKNEKSIDVLIVGTGCSGLYCALNMPSDVNITMITKSDVESSDSYLAQGGICVLRDQEDYDSFFEDTLKAGHYENDKTSVDIMIKQSRETIAKLIGYGVEFARLEDGQLDYTREGAHSKKRILYHADITGKEITSKLLAEVRKRQNITILEYTTLIDIIEEDIKENACCIGAVVRKGNGSIEKLYAAYTVLATGGIGGLYRHSTNFRHLTGDALAIAHNHNVKLKDIDYIQIHPTTFYSADEEDRSFLISESVRGEGAKLYNKNMERFVDELLPRDLLTKAIRKQMELDGTDFVWEDLRPIPEKELMEHFPNIVAYCKEKGYDVTKECIPVVPAQHYFMGGIKVDYKSKTSMDRLYAVGETACNGVHGKNRLASNSLLESLVFAGLAAEDIVKCRCQQRGAKGTGNIDKTKITEKTELTGYKEDILTTYKEIVLNEIKKEKNKRKGDKNMFDNATLKLKVDPLILSALEEDITSEDVSTNSVMRDYALGEVDLICKEDGILCGIQVFERVFTLLDEKTIVSAYVKDGERITKGQLIAKVQGDIRVLLSGERTALNYLQRMSGVATYTNKVAELLKGTKTKLLDTRKTTPNNRIFEKYAVRIGGGNNHRYNLSDGVLLKDNHIGAAGSVAKAVAMAKEYAPFVRKIEVEVETLDMVKEAVEAGAHIIMLDNMSTEQLKEAISYIDGRAEVEISGNVTKENIGRLTDMGVDYISSGALTHSSPILDLSLKNLHAL